MATDKVYYETEKYIVTESGNNLVLGEDGQYSARDGYAVVNRETGVVEHTTIMLPGAIFQCQHFNDSLVSLLNPPTEPEDGLTNLDVPDDIIPN